MMNRIKVRRKLKKYNLGGAVSGISQGASMVGGLMSTSKDEDIQGVGSFLSGAGAGAAFGPIGAVVGGGLNLYKHHKEKKANEARMKAEREAREKAEVEARRIEDTARLYSYNQYGDNSKVIYKYGGEIAGTFPEGGEVVPLSSDTSEVVGKSHEQGGIKFDTAELEGGETIKELRNGSSFVFSEELGFAKEHKKLSKMKNKVEGKKGRRAKNTLARLTQRETLLMNQQENLKEGSAPLGDKKIMQDGGLHESFTNPNYKKPLGKLFYPDGLPAEEEGQYSEEGDESFLHESFTNPNYKKKQGKMFYPEGLPQTTQNVYKKDNSEGTSMNPNYKAPDFSLKGFNIPSQDGVVARSEGGVSVSQDLNKNILQNYSTDSNMAKLARSGKSINSEADLQRVAKELNISPNALMDELEGKAGKGSTGTRGWGDNNYRNLGPKTFSAYQKMYGTPPTEPSFRPVRPSSKELTKASEEGESTASSLTSDTGNKRRGLNLGDYKTEGLNALGVAGRFIDNIHNARRIREMEGEHIPQEKLNEAIKLKRLNYNDQLIETDRQVGVANKAGGRLSNSNTSAKQAAMNLSSGISAKNKIRGAEERGNTQIANREIGANAQITAGNNKTTLSNEMRRLGARDDIRRERSANISNLTEDIGTIVQDAKKEDLGNRNNKLYVSLSDPRKQKQLAKVNRRELERMGFNSRDIEKMKTGKLTDEDMDGIASKNK